MIRDRSLISDGIPNNPVATPALHRLAAGRAAAVDAFRGLTFLAMIFVNELGGVTGITRWLKHMPADADAMSFPDVVFPAFLFIVGMAIPFSINARLARGGDASDVQRHVVARAFALIVMGLFMVNAEDGFNAQAMPLRIEWWSLLFYAAVFMVWGMWRGESAVLMRRLRIAGIALMAVLALVYRGGPDGSRWMTPQWWGILGLIGWAYFFSCEFYLLAEGGCRCCWRCWRPASPTTPWPASWRCRRRSSGCSARRRTPPIRRSCWRARSAR